MGDISMKPIKRSYHSSYLIIDARKPVFGGGGGGGGGTGLRTTQAQTSQRNHAV